MSASAEPGHRPAKLDANPKHFSRDPSVKLDNDIVVDGVAVGENLAKNSRTKPDGVWEMPLSAGVDKLAKGRLTVSVKDRQGNTSRLERTFSVEPK